MKNLCLACGHPRKNHYLYTGKCELCLCPKYIEKGYGIIRTGRNYRHLRSEFRKKLNKQMDNPMFTYIYRGINMKEVLSEIGYPLNSETLDHIIPLHFFNTGDYLEFIMAFSPHNLRWVSEEDATIKGGKIDEKLITKIKDKQLKQFYYKRKASWNT